MSLADDNRLFLEGLTDHLEAYGYDVVASACNGIEAIERARIHRPYLILMDVRMPRCDGLAATRAIAVTQPETRIVMLRTSDEEEHLYQAIAAGAFGYLLKSMRGDELIEALEQVAEGVPPFSPGLAACLLAEFARRSTDHAIERRGAPRDRGRELFTPRELEVLRSVAGGHTYRETATLLSSITTTGS